jgi:hypothetical protein
VFVGSAVFPDTPHARSATTAGTSQVSDPVLAKRLRDRYDGPDHEPWTGWISFNRNDPWYFDAAPTASGVVPADKVDFVSVALHEMGHVLGIGGSNAWKALVDGDFFIGPNAMKVYGGKVPLAPDHGHLPLNLLFNGKEVLMDAASAKGERSFPSALDLALLQDIGYEL